MKTEQEIEEALGKLHPKVSPALRQRMMALHRTVTPERSRTISFPRIILGIAACATLAGVSIFFLRPIPPPEAPVVNQTPAAEKIDPIRRSGFVLGDNGQLFRVVERNPTRPERRKFRRLVSVTSF